MKKDTAIKLNWMIAAAGLVLAILLLTVAKACPAKIETAAGGTAFMSCHYTVKAAVLLSCIAVVFGLESALRKRLNAITGLVLGIAIIALPNILGICGMTEMRCHTSALCMRVIGAVIGVIGVIQLLAKGDKDL